MCVYSLIMDHYYDKWKWYPPPPMPVTYPSPNTLPVPPITIIPHPVSPITPAEIEEFRKLLERAREYDRKNNEPDCELEEKRKKLKDLAKDLGVEINFV